MTDKTLLEFLKIIFEPTFKRDEFNNVAVFTMFNEIINMLLLLNSTMIQKNFVLS